MTNKVSGVVTSLLAAYGAIGTGFLCASAGLSWAKIKMSGACDMTQYLMLYYGVCDKVSVRSLGDADRHCWEWRDDGTWENLKGDFEDDASIWQINGYLIGAAAIIGFVATCLIIAAGFNLLRTSSELSITTLVFYIVALGLSISGWALALETVQLDEDEWKSGTGCSTKVELAQGLACAMLGSILLLLAVVANAFRTKALC